MQCARLTQAEWQKKVSHINRRGMLHVGLLHQSQAIIVFTATPPNLAKPV